MLRDGDCGFIIVRDGEDLKLQSVEADRIGSPYDQTDTDKYIGGINTDDYGRPVSYTIFTRTINNQYISPVDIVAKEFIHLFDAARLDEYRGRSAFAAALNATRDLQEAIKADELLKTQIGISNSTAQERVIAADQIYGLANSKETGRVFEFFTKPTVRNIIATAIQGQGGVKTPLGSVEIANIKKAMQLAGATEKELDAAQTMLRSTTMLNMQDTISLMQKQGAITEGERALISQLNPNVFEDTRNSAMAKAQLVKARAEYDQDIAESYNKWAKKNPNGFVNDFKQSNEFKERYNDYNKYTSQLAKKYFPNIAPAPSTRRNTGPLESQIQ
jgi:hypothetical protein